MFSEHNTIIQIIKNHTSTIIARHLIFAWRYYTILGWVFQARS